MLWTNGNDVRICPPWLIHWRIVCFRGKFEKIWYFYSKLIHFISWKDGLALRVCARAVIEHGDALCIHARIGSCGRAEPNHARGAVAWGPCEEGEASRCLRGWLSEWWHRNETSSLFAASDVSEAVSENDGTGAKQIRNAIFYRYFWIPTIIGQAHSYFEHKYYPVDSGVPVFIFFRTKPLIDMLFERIAWMITAGGALIGWAIFYFP